MKKKFEIIKTRQNLKKVSKEKNNFAGFENKNKTKFRKI